MASSNKHWPSMFKSKPHHQHQWQHDINSPLLPSACHRSSPYRSGCEERTPEPKPRWNPKPEQIRILEAIFNSGMVNPPRDEIRKIRAQLQEYGQVGDANVFYWFQNRKSRSKHKLRVLHGSKQTGGSTTAAGGSAASSSSSSSSSPSPRGPSKSNNKKSATSNNGSGNKLSLSPPVIIGGGDGSVNPTVGILPAGHTEFLAEPAFFFPVTQQTSVTPQLGFAFGDQLSNVIHVSNDELQKHQQYPAPFGPCTGLLLSEILNVNNYGSSSNAKEQDELRGKILDPQLGDYSSGFSTTTHCNSVPCTLAVATVPSNINQLQVVEEAARPERLTVFINEVAFEVASGPFNVREAFGEDAVLINSSGQPIVTNEWGLTLHPLQHGASYYLI